MEAAHEVVVAPDAAIANNALGSRMSCSGVIRMKPCDAEVASSLALLQF